MPVAFPIVVLAAVVAALLAGLIFYSERIRRINQLYRGLRARYGGELLPAGLWQHPQLVFPYQGGQVLVGTESTGRGSESVQTVLRIPWPDPDLYLELYPRRFYMGVIRLLGGQDIRTGTPRFDGDYFARGSDAERVRSLLNAGVQTQVELLRQLTEQRDFYLLIAQGELYLRKRGGLSELPRLLRFTMLGLELYEQAMLTNMAGIEIVAEQLVPAAVAEGAVCRVCGDGIGADVVFCRDCQTPHHFDCWSWSGKCSIYGCGGTRYVTGRRVARTARKTRS